MASTADIWFVEIAHDPVAKRPRPWIKSEGMLWRIVRAIAVGRRSNRLKGQDQRRVLAAEAERIRHDRGDARVAGDVGNHVERYRRIRDVIIDRRWYALMG